ncbi:hypothetical protein [Acinetobacter sp.]|uniref:hypothetical protein n=1 Tax=Acinetobacter sp. TaxID=472 RepID=UPI00388D41AB
MHIAEKIVDFTKLTSEQKKYFFETMLAFDQQIFPNSTPDEIYEFVYDIDAVAVQVVHYFHENKLIGQNIIQLLKLYFEDKPIFVVSSRLGTLAGYGKSNRTLKTAIRIVINYRIRHPTIPLWFVPTIIQPKVYKNFASRSQNFFPRKAKPMPEEYLKVLDMIQQRKNKVQKRREDIFVHPNVMPQTTPADIQRLRNKTTQHINFFTQHVPDYFDGMGLMCICKLDLKTISEAIFNVWFNRHV